MSWTMDHRKQGLFHILICLSLACALVSPTLADDLEDFLEDSAQSKESILIDIEDEVGAKFEVVDEITERKRVLEESLIIPPKYKEPRSFGTPEPFTAQLKEGTILRDLKTGKGFILKNTLVVKAQEVVLGASKVFIFDRDGKKRYETKSENAVKIDHIVKMTPDIDPLVVYSDKPRFGAVDKETRFSHFFSYHIEAVRTEYFATIFRGTRQSANSNLFQLKSYLLAKDFPIQVGFNLSGQIGYWEDPNLGIMTWGGVFFGPSFMRSFWKSEDSQWNLHLSGFRSLYHRSEKAPDTHSFSTIGLEVDLEKEIGTKYGPVTLGISYRWNRSSINSSTEFLQNDALKGQVAAFGAYLGYRYNWSL